MGIVVIAAILALAIYRNIASGCRHCVVLGLGPADAIIEVESAYPLLTWANTSGFGRINKGRAANSERMLVVSVDIADRGDGTTEMRTWGFDRKDIAGFTIANGALKATQLAGLRRHPTCIAESQRR